MARTREKPIHPAVQRLWDKKRIASPKEAASKTGVETYRVAEMCDVEKFDAVIARVKLWARTLGVTPDELLTSIQQHIESETPKAS